MLPALSFLFALLAYFGSGPENLTSAPSQDRYPSFSPDGKKVAFETDREGTWDVFVMNADGSDPRPVTSGPANDRHPSWSPDGRTILFTREFEGTSDIYTVDLAGGKVELFAYFKGDKLFADWHPDGKSVAFTSDSLPDTNIYTIATGGKTADKQWSSAERDVWPRYSPDGRHVVFFSRRDSAGREDDIYLADTKGGEVTRLTDYPGNEFCPAWSKDGKLIAFARSDEKTGRMISVIDRSGKPLFVIGKGFERVTEPAWSPDGKKIAYSARKEGVWDVWVEDVAKQRR